MSASLAYPLQTGPIFDVAALMEDVLEVHGFLSTSPDLFVGAEALGEEDIAVAPWNNHCPSLVASTVQLVLDGSDSRKTCRLMRRARRHGESTCFALRRSLPIPKILHQLHLGHRFVLVPWSPHLDQFTLGAIRNAQENGSQVIADGIADPEQARTASSLNVTLGTIRVDGRTFSGACSDSPS